MTKFSWILAASILLSVGVTPTSQAAIVNPNGSGTLRANATADCSGCIDTSNPGQNIFPGSAVSWSNTASVGNSAMPGAGGGGSANGNSSATGSYAYDALLGTFTGTGSVSVAGSSGCGIISGVSFCGLAGSTGQADSFSTFTLTSSYNYQITASVSTASQSPNDRVTFGAQGSPLSFFTLASTGTLSQTGTLAAGTYVVAGTDVSSGATVGGSASAYGSTDSFTYKLQLTPVPIPAAVWLFGSGLFWFGSVARKRRI